MIISRLFIVLSACILAACATTPLPLNELKAVPVARTTWVSSTNSHAGTLIIARDVGVKASGAHVTIGVDGKKAGEIQPGEVLRLRVDPGTRVVSTMVFAGLIGGLLDANEVSVVVQPLKEVVLRLGFK